MRRQITSETWEQIKTAFFSGGFSLREIARKLDIPEGTVLAHAKRDGWTQQIQTTTRQLTVVQSDAITVPQSLASILAERKERTRLGLAKFAAEAAEQAGEHPNKLLIAGKVKDVASVHSTLWPEEPQNNQILHIGLLTGQVNVWNAKTGVIDTGPDKGQRVDLETGIITTGPSAGLPGHR
jgi:Putative ATPase subunit of terminase (gpP-like)